MWDPKTVDAVTFDRAYSIDKAKDELGYSPIYSPEDGLRETVEWCRQNGIVPQITRVSSQPLECESYSDT